MLTFLVAGAVGCVAYFVISLFRIGGALAAVARTTETEGIAAATVSWGRLVALPFDWYRCRGYRCAHREAGAVTAVASCREGGRCSGAALLRPRSAAHYFGTTIGKVRPR
jgi:hypothetical protein